MILIIFQIIALIMSAVVHEVAHGYMAYRLGDNTAKNEGRLTLNPIKHLDLFGSIFLPLILIITSSPFFLAWAKPVPYNPYNLRDRKFGDLKVALVGPLSNLILAIIFGLISRVLYFYAGASMEISGSLVNSIFLMTVVITQVNLILMIFNLIPLPPLDGSKILLTFLPARFKIYFYKYEQFGLILLLILIASNAFNFVSWLVYFLFSLIVGF